MFRPKLVNALETQENRIFKIEGEINETKKSIDEIRGKISEREKDLESLCDEMDVSLSDMESETDMGGISSFDDSTILIPEYQDCISSWLEDPECHFQLLYRASRDGFLAKDFHNRCDGKGNTVSLVETAEGNIFGGFIPLPWSSVGGPKYENESFLFSLKNPHGVPPIKFPKKVVTTGKGVRSAYHAQGYGIWFGSNDIIIFSNSNTSTSSYSTLGVGFEYHKTIAEVTTKRIDAHSFFAGKKNFKVKELEVFTRI